MTGQAFDSSFSPERPDGAEEKRVIVFHDLVSAFGALDRGRAPEGFPQIAEYAVFKQVPAVTSVTPWTHCNAPLQLIPPEVRPLNPPKGDLQGVCFIVYIPCSKSPSSGD